MDFQAYSFTPFLYIPMDAPVDLWKKEEVISQWILLSLLFITCLIGFIVYFFFWTIRQNYKNKLQQQQVIHQHRLQLQEATLSSLEAERKRFALEIHDSIIGKMTAIRYGLELQLEQTYLDKMLEDCIVESRQLSHHLFPPLLHESTIDELIEQNIQIYKKGYSILYHKRELFPIVWDETRKLHLIRILQELLTNTKKHAQATSIHIMLRINNYIFLSYRDNGRGLLGENNTGLGLNSIQNRILKLDGKIKISSKKTGFHILIYIPR